MTTKFNIPEFESVSILVIGDVMLDRYWHGNAQRISPEAPVPVVHVQKLEERPGAAGNVAYNLTALGCKTTLQSVVGQDEAGLKLRQLLQEVGVNCQLEIHPDWQTITKVRVLGCNQQLLRIDFEERAQKHVIQALQKNYQTNLKQCQAVILSDYGKGCLGETQALIRQATAAGVPVLIDPKSSDFSIYRGATLITPNLKEFQAVVGECADEKTLVERGYALMKEHDIYALLITRSERGMTLLESGKMPVHLPTRAREVFDVTGAGDTVIAVVAAALAAGQNLVSAATLANFAAGIVVSKLGAAVVTVPELRRALQRQLDSDFGVLTEEELLVAVADARAHGETIVMTNGCFDILHAGHIHYLEQAKKLGKRLVVAVNTDESVAKLKGSNRPLNSLAQRMAVLVALRAVDWVVPFAEETPERLIQAVSPDILVKGGDYRVEQVAGHQHVLSYGGRVEILDFVEGLSTSGLIQKITAKNELS